MPPAGSAAPAPEPGRAGHAAAAAIRATPATASATTPGTGSRARRRGGPRGAGRSPRPGPVGRGDRVRLVFFDLDGTLYDDLLYSSAYACALALRIPTRKRDRFLRDAFAGSPINRHLRLGRIYDRETDTLLGHPLLEPGLASSWDGEQRRSWQPVQAGGHVGAAGRYLALGDAWTLVTAAGMRCGASPEDCVEALAEVRSRVAVPPARSCSGHPFFRQGAPFLRVLVTNASEPHARVMLRHLDLEDAFAHTLTDAGKPGAWREIITRLEREAGIPRAAMVAVGDNLLNDVLPVVEQGGRAVLVDRHGWFARFRCATWIRCRSLEEALETLSRFRPPHPAGLPGRSGRVGSPVRP